MNKSELIKEVARKSGITISEAQKIVEVTLTIIAEHLESGDSVRLLGFGTFSVRERASRIGINPRTGQRVEIRSAKVPHFAPGSQLKAAASDKDDGKTDDPGEFIREGKK